ncbi:uncharacterized protein K452DRAFT_36621 [Aplosporella prunicola CBS 121167]|uniref:Uncharacterized protein n=1 Tax=Aplosporella prunicola CBS 121167 TaxID=1176127 RepID=A0A6A6BE68_9PEZI|nr:uncharacterized protein K452DRAFT_36621 [Aplosporella prunicola CBS 121167]KAF2141217.1 hypothetical protein K452DRAFT_36621 [Aplosporella prunicola CBS 121167]
MRKWHPHSSTRSRGRRRRTSSSKGSSTLSRTRIWPLTRLDLKSKTSPARHLRAPNALIPSRALARSHQRGEQLAGGHTPRSTNSSLNSNFANQTKPNQTTLPGGHCSHWSDGGQSEAHIFCRCPALLSSSGCTPTSAVKRGSSTQRQADQNLTAPAFPAVL